MTIRKTALMGLSAMLSTAGAAYGADYSPIYAGLIQSAPELVPVEIGTGWYLRGDAAYGFESDYDGSIGVYTPFDSASLGYDELRLGDSVSGGVGIGYQFNEYLRGDVTARYGTSDVDGAIDLTGDCVGGAGPCDLSGSADVRTWDLMANAYVDLGTFVGFTPYVGGGVGAVNVSYEDATLGYCDAALSGGGCATTNGDGDDSWRFAYALMAGVSYDVNRSLAIDFGYRYLNVDGGKIFDLPLDSAGFTGSGIDSDDDGFDQHTIMAGIRYSLW